MVVYSFIDSNLTTFDFSTLYIIMNPILALIEYHGSVIPKLSEADVIWESCTRTLACNLCHRVYHPVSSDELSVVLCYYCDKLRYLAITKSNASPVSEVRDYVTKYFEIRHDLILNARRALGIMEMTNCVHSSLNILTIRMCYICAQGKPHGYMLMFQEPQIVAICVDCLTTARNFNVELKDDFNRMLLYTSEITTHADIVKHIKGVIHALIISTLKI